MCFDLFYILSLRFTLSALIIVKPTLSGFKTFLECNAIKVNIQIMWAAILFFCRCPK